MYRLKADGKNQWKTRAEKSREEKRREETRPDQTRRDQKGREAKEAEDRRQKMQAGARKGSKAAKRCDFQSFVALWPWKV